MRRVPRRAPGTVQTDGAVSPARRLGRWARGALTIATLVLITTIAWPSMPVLPVATWLFLPGLLGLGLVASMGLVAIGVVVRPMRRTTAMTGVALAASVLVVLAGQTRAGDAVGVGWWQGLGVGLDIDRGPPSPAGTMLVTYAHRGASPLVADLWSPGPRHPATGRAVVWVHGGGWTGGHRSSRPRWDEWLTDRGVTVIDLDYTLADPMGPGRPTWDEAAADVRCAVGWAQGSEGADAAIDPAKVTIAGYSAGATLALLAAWARHGDAVLGGAPAGCAEPSQPVASVAALYPVTDVASWVGNDPSGMRLGEFSAASYLGGQPRDVVDRAAAASPITLVRPGLAPTLLVHGEQDRIVSISQSADLARRLQGAGDQVSLVRLPGAGHNFDVFWSSIPTRTARAHLARLLSVRA